MRSNAALWLRFVGWFVGTLLGSFVAVFVFIVCTDPYDRGHSLALVSPGIFDESPRTANVSRGRDPRFNAAIVGNSHMQLLDPDRLFGSTGYRFTQMSAPATGPREQVVLLKWFIDHHRDIKALVIGTDATWCGQDGNPPLASPFPFWLYGGDLDYFAHVFGTRSLSYGWRRILVTMGLLPVSDPAGYWNYEIDRKWGFRPFLPTLAERAPVDVAPAPAPDLRFPFLGTLESVLAPLRPDARVALVMPPIFYTSLPVTGTAAMHQMAGCKYELVSRAADHGWRFVDFYADTPISRDPENFWDFDHLRMPAVRRMEERIAQELSDVGYAGGGRPPVERDR